MNDQNIATIDLTKFPGWLSKKPKPGPDATKNADICREILRTIDRLPKTPVIVSYHQLLFKLISEIHGKRASFGQDPVGLDAYAKADLLIDDQQISELAQWLRSNPQYVFSFVAGLALDGTQNTAWAFAYG